MPGIVGLITKKPYAQAIEELSQMLATMRHEPFYVTGKYVNADLGVYVGFTAHENSVSAGMPVCNGTGDVALVFSGEEYSEAGISANQKASSDAAAPYSPSYLVRLYEENPTFPVMLNGRFHGLVIDRRRKSALLFNDRFAVHRLYYHESDQGFYFAAEAKAILAVRPELRATDPQSVAEFIACGCVLENRTIFRNVNIVPPASGWLFCAGSLQRKDAYFQSRDWEDQSRLEPEQYYQEFCNTFARKLPLYLSSNQPIAMSLTGGLDTRAVMAFQKCSPGSLPCYTYSGMFRECRDVVVARQVAAVCHQKHDVIKVGSEFLGRFPNYAERSVYLTDGCVDLLRSPDLYVSEMARRIAPVRLTGLYGDEVLRNMPAFKPVCPRTDLFDREVTDLIHAAAATYDRALTGHPLSFAVFRQAPWYHYGTLALEQSQVTVRTPFLDNDLIRLGFQAPKSAFTNNDLRIRLLNDGNAVLGRIPTDRGLAVRRGQLRPGLFYGFLEFLFKAEYAYDYGMPQWLARIDHFLEPLHLERLFLGRHKLYHFRIWYRRELSAYVREMLLDSRTLARPYLDKRAVEATVQHHLAGVGNYTAEIHKLLTLELIHRLFVD